MRKSLNIKHLRPRAPRAGVSRSLSRVYATWDLGKVKRPFKTGVSFFLVVYSRAMETRIETFGKL